MPILYSMRAFIKLGSYARGHAPATVRVEPAVSIAWLRRRAARFGTLQKTVTNTGMFRTFLYLLTQQREFQPPTLRVVVSYELEHISGAV